MIHNGVDFGPNRDHSVLRRLDVKMPYLLYAGSYEPRKNLAGALECYREVVRSGYPHLLVAIVERQSGHAARIHSLIAELGLQDRVLLRHGLSEPDLRALYTQAQVVLFPSLAEGFGLPPVQAAACGVPVLVSDLPVLREIMGKAAEYVDPLEPRAMAALVGGLIENQQRRRELVAAGAALARQLTVDMCVSRHVEIYDALAAPLREPAAAAG